MNSNEDLPPEDSDVAFNTFIGVLVSVCGNVLISVALNLQKLAHNKIQERQVAKYFANMDEPPRWISTAQSYRGGNTFFPDDGYSSPRSSAELPPTEQDELERQKFIIAMAQEQTKGGDSDYLRSKLWWLGISLMVLGEVGNFVAYGFAPASTIAPLGTTTLVANVILAPLMLKERFRKRDLLGVILAVTGAGMVVLSSNSEETALSPDLIMEALTETRSLVYFAVTGIAIAALTILSPLYGSRSIMIDLGLVAIYGGYTVLCTKSVASLLSLTLFRLFAYPVSYLLILTLVVTAILQIKYLNKALQRFDSTEVIPTQFVLFTISAIIGSAVLYHDFDNMSMEQTSRFMTGCTIEFLGVYLITSKRNKDRPLLSVRADEIAFANDEAIDVLLPNNGAAAPEPANDRTEPPRPSSPHARFAPDPPLPKRARPVSIHDLAAVDPRRLSTTFRPSTSPPEEWQHDTATAKQRAKRHRRSSMFRGISLTSQLVDRMNEESLVGTEGSKQPIQLPPSSPTWQSLSFSHHRRGDSTTLSNLFSGLTRGSTSQHDPLPASAMDADAVEIEIPTASSLSPKPDNPELLLAFQQQQQAEAAAARSSKRDSTRLVDIEEGMEH